MWHVGEEEKYTQGFGGNPEGQGPVGRPGRKWKIINTGLKEM
jgi:hypothetical protein